uniref:F-box domain-containing protein n=1 Tax=Aegilops tauschii subsp. strangulata TaxID=200361 RepID=A0A453J9E4_AEGTS
TKMEMEMQTPYLPPEIVVSLILPRLPVRSLLRFRCVCQAWQSAIDDDDYCPREHLRLQSHVQ